MGSYGLKPQWFLAHALRGRRPLLQGLGIQRGGCCMQDDALNKCFLNYKLVLINGDKVFVQSSAASSIDAVLSILEIT
jgi:hypothetical protein